MTDIFSCQSCGLEHRYNAVLLKYDKVVKECAELKQSLAKVQSQRDEYIKEINQVITARLKATQDLSRMTEERNSAIQEYNLIMSERDTVHKEIEKLQEELCENQKKLTTLQEEKIVNIEQIDSLKREITSVLIDRDRLSKKIQEDRARYGDFGEDSVSPLRSPSSSVNNNTNSTSNNNNSHNQWDSSSSGISSSWKQVSMASIGSPGQSHLSSSRLDSMEHVNVEIDLLRRQNERLQQELMYSHNEIDKLKKERDTALEFKEKVALERESMRTLCDRLRKERDRVVCDLAEALRDSDDMRRQLNDAQKELSELREKLESDKGCGNNIYKDQSCSSISSTLSSPTHLADSQQQQLHQQQKQQQQQAPTSPKPTLLDRAYNKIYGDRRSRKTIDVTPEQEARETLASLDKVLADYSNQIKVATKALEKSQKEKERNGGTWPKYRGPQILKMSEDEKLNGGPTMRPINRKGRKSLAVFNPIIKTDNHLSKGDNSSCNEPQSVSTLISNRNESNNCPIYDKIDETPPPTSSTIIADYHSHSSRSTTSNSSTPIPIGGSLTSTEKISSNDLHPESSNCLHNYVTPRESAYFRSRVKADSIDYSVVSAQIQYGQERKIGDSNYRRSNSSTKLRPHSIHDVLSDAFSRTTLSLSNQPSSLSTSDHHSSSLQQSQQQQQQQGQQQSQQQNHHHQQQSSRDSYELALSKPNLPIPPARIQGDPIGLFRVAHKRLISSNHAHPVSSSLPSSSQHNSPNSISYLTRSHHSPSLSIHSTLPPRCSPQSPHSPIYNPHISRTNEMNINEQNHLYDLPTTTSTSGTTSNSINSSSTNNNGANINHHYSNSMVRPMSLYQPNIAKLAVKDSHHENNRYSNASPTLSLGSDYPNLINVPRSTSSGHHHHHHHYGQASLHIPHSRMDMGHEMGYKSDENESDFVTCYDRLATFPKRSARIRIPSNPSVTSTCSSGKLSTSSIDKVSSSAHSDRGSPLSFNVEWLSSGRRHRNVNNLKPCPGDIRHIELCRSSGTLGINISSGPAGVFITTVEKDSLANQAGIQIGDQILEICGINMRNAVDDHAANILRQCAESLNLLVQYNPNKLIASKQSALSQAHMSSHVNQS